MGTPSMMTIVIINSFVIINHIVSIGNRCLPLGKGIRKSIDDIMNEKKKY
jgi:hypothetical protein